MSHSARLQDPDNLAGNNLEEYANKLIDTMGKMARSSQKGGSPFFFALLATKYHYLKDHLGLKKVMTRGDETEEQKKEKEERKWKTAATDGISYFWYPEFLKKLNHNEIRTVMIHEALHVICRHCEKGEGKQSILWNYATDYYVNAAIEKDYIDSGRIRQHTGEGEHPIWNGAFGKNITFAELRNRLKEQHDADTDEKREALKKKYEKEGPHCFADFSLFGKSSEDIYRELIEMIRLDAPSLLEGNGMCFMPGGFDSHIDVKVDRKEIMRQLLQAAETASKMKGSVPSDILEELRELQAPRLTWQDLCRQALRRAKESKGKQNDWSSLNKRALSMNLYVPKKVQYNGKVLVMLDTSGSMGQEDFAYGIGQLAVLDKHAKGWVVPVDAAPHWEGVTEIRKIDDLKKIKLLGRGGTDFVQFFTEYQSKMKKQGPFDLIIVLTDGYFGQIPIELKPPCDVVWVSTNRHEIDPPFGFSAPLKADR